MSLSSTERDKIMADCYADPVLFCKTFLFEKFYREIPWVHRGLLAVLTGKTKFLLKYPDLHKVMKNFVHETPEGQTRQVFHVFVNDMEVTADDVALLDLSMPSAGTEVDIKLDLGTFTLILMPRGSSKTTIAGLAVPLYKLLYQEDKFTLYVSEGERHSQGQLESVRKEIVQNEIIHEIFGNLKPKRSEEEAWSKEKFETTTGVAMQARGKGSAIRGINHNNQRPTTILVDDPQSKKSVKSEMVREDDKKWAFAELLPARARVVGARGKIIALGTWLGKHSLVAIWSRDERFTTVKLGIKDIDGEYIWPDYMDAAEEKAEKASFAREGLTGDFYREYYNIEVIDEELPFQAKHIIYDAEIPEKGMAVATFADLASSEKRTADFSAICTVGITTGGTIWLLDAWVERVGVQEEVKVEEYFRQSLKWKTNIHGFEANAYQAVFGSLLRGEMFKRKHYFEIIPITHKTRKVDRIRGALRPRYASGHIRHRMPFMRLEQQLFDFRMDGSHDHDDGPDCFAAALVLLDPAAAYHADDDPANDQYESIPEGDTDVYWAC